MVSSRAWPSTWLRRVRAATTPSSPRGPGVAVNGCSVVGVEEAANEGAARARRLPLCRRRSGEPLTDREDVPLAVLEPGRLRATPGRDAVHRLQSRHVVLFEDHALFPERGHFGDDIVHRPERGA